MLPMGFITHYYESHEYSNSGSYPLIIYLIIITSLCQLVVLDLYGHGQSIFPTHLYVVSPTNFFFLYTLVPTLNDLHSMVKRYIFPDSPVFLSLTSCDLIIDSMICLLQYLFSDLTLLFFHSSLIIYGFQGSSQ